MKNFVHEGLDIKVCLLRNRTIPCPSVVKVELDDGEVCAIEVVQMQAREYGKVPKTKTVYVEKAVKVVMQNEEIKDDPSHNEDRAELPHSDEGTTSGTKKKKKNKKKNGKQLSPETRKK
ncbi:hypothetical protein LINPERPRIM_LOCUS30820 [Linum perenne]